MPSFGNTSKCRLATCHPDLQTIFNEVIKETECTILCGWRGRVEQDKAYSDGLSQVRWPNSKHNASPSQAVDAGPYFVELRNTDWKDKKAFSFFAGQVMTIARRLLKEGRISHRLRWGGDWDGDGRTADQEFHDLPHFELIPA